MPQLALVVENDEGTQKLLQVLLQRRGFDVDAVRSGSEALLLTRRLRYAVVVLDLMLPGFDGVSLLKIFREEMPHMLGRTVVVSSAPQPRLEQIAAEFSEVAQIRKPFEIDALIAAIDRHAVREEEPVLAFDENFCRGSVRCRAKSGVVTKLIGRTLHVTSSFGFSGNALEKYFPLNIDEQFPICAAARGRQVWCASLTHLGSDYPLLLPVWKEQHSNAIAALPVERDGEVIGAVGWSFSEPQVFRGGERECLEAMAAMAANHLREIRSPAAS